MIQDRHPDDHPVVRWLSLLPWGYFAFLLGLIAAEFHSPSLRVLRVVEAVVLLLPWATGFLLLPIGRGGPLKNWAIPWLMSLSFGAIIMDYGLHMIHTWVEYRDSLTLLRSAVLIILTFAYYIRIVASLCPRQCPGCGRTALIPLRKLLKHEKRSSNTRWCAICEGEYWKDRQGVWQKERRTTWYDRQLGREKPSSGVRPRILGTERQPKTKVSLTSSTTDAEA